jgi:hypothetical protein
MLTTQDIESVPLLMESFGSHAALNAVERNEEKATAPVPLPLGAGPLTLLDEPTGVINIASSPMNREEVSSKYVGRRRSIILGPPPMPKPVPMKLSDTGEQAPVSNKALAAIPKLNEQRAETHDFRCLDGEEAQEGDEDNVPIITAYPLAVPKDAEAVAATRISSSSLLPVPAPERRGSLKTQHLLKVFFDLAVEEETGLLVLYSGESIKEIFLLNGDPHYVASNLAEELFGQYLVEKKVISNGELSMALAMLPHFDGKLGNALVGLKLLRPMQVLRHLTQQVRQKLLNAFTWRDGSYAYYKGKRYDQEAAPLGLDAFEVIGSWIKKMPYDLLEKSIEPLLKARPYGVKPPPVPPEVFRLGRGVREIYERLDGQLPLGELLQLHHEADKRGFFAKVVYLLVETGLAAY